METTFGPQKLLDSENRWETRLGAFFPQEGRVVFHGKDLLRDFDGFSWMALLLYGITGRTFSDKQLRLLEKTWTLCASYPDPRIWNNRIAALAGTARSTAGLALGAANAVSEATLYGQRPNIRSIDFFLRAQKQLDQGAELESVVAGELDKHKRLFGYGRPLAGKDERIAPILRAASEADCAEGPHVKLAFAVEQILLRRGGHLHMNIAGLLAALAADLGFSPTEYHRFMALRFSAGMAACFADASEKPAGTLFPMRCQRLVYDGCAQRGRPWPKA